MLRAREVTVDKTSFVSYGQFINVGRTILISILGFSFSLFSNDYLFFSLEFMFLNSLTRYDKNVSEGHKKEYDEPIISVGRFHIFFEFLNLY